MTGLIVFGAKYLFAVVPLIVLLVFWKAASEERRAMLLRGVVMMLLAVALAKGGGALYNEPRPFVVHHVAPLIPHVADNGFPSDHTLVTFACAFLILPFSRRAAGIAILIATAVGSARIACNLHSPLDIVASVLMAAVANLIALKCLPKPIVPTSPQFRALS
jgi:undecaprenyl-diphosphatase